MGAAFPRALSPAPSPMPGICELRDLGERLHPDAESFLGRRRPDGPRRIFNEVAAGSRPTYKAMPPGFE